MEIAVPCCPTCPYAVDEIQAAPKANRSRMSVVHPVGSKLSAEFAIRQRHDPFVPAPQVKGGTKDLLEDPTSWPAPAAFGDESADNVFVLSVALGCGPNSGWNTQADSQILAAAFEHPVQDPRAFSIETVGELRVLPADERHVERDHVDSSPEPDREVSGTGKVVYRDEQRVPPGRTGSSRLA